VGSLKNHITGAPLQSTDNYNERKAVGCVLFPLDIGLLCLFPVGRRMVTVKLAGVLPHFTAQMWWKD